MCNSSVAHEMKSFVNGTTTTHKFMHAASPGSVCIVNVTAVFGTSFISNKVTSTTNIASAGIIATRNT